MNNLGLLESIENFNYKSKELKSKIDISISEIDITKEKIDDSLKQELAEVFRILGLSKKLYENSDRLKEAFTQKLINVEKTLFEKLLRDIKVTDLNLSSIKDSMKKLRYSKEKTYKTNKEKFIIADEEYKEYLEKYEVKKAKLKKYLELLLYEEKFLMKEYGLAIKLFNNSFDIDEANTSYDSLNNHMNDYKEGEENAF